MHTLPFGSSASVLHFNRVSWLLWALGCRLGLLWSCYYDDHPILCPKDLEASSMGAAKAMFNLLGFHFAEDKLAPPADKAELLGVELDLKQSKQGKISIRNRQDRVTDLEAAMSEILEARKLRPKDLPSHLGRMQFAEMQIAGRAGKIAMHDLRTMGSSGAAYVTLEDDQLDALKLLRTRLTSGKPRSLVAQPPSKPWLLFTDGALEYNNDSPVATIGAILLSPAGHLVFWLQGTGRSHEPLAI